MDQPPIIGNISTVRVTIAKSDNAEGVIEFDAQYIHLQGRFTLSFQCSLEDKPGTRSQIFELPFNIYTEFQYKLYKHL